MYPMQQVLDADGQMATQYDFSAVEEDLYKCVRSCVYASVGFSSPRKLCGVYTHATVWEGNQSLNLTTNSFPVYI